MYLSHPVRRMRKDPGEGEVSLIVEYGDAATDPPEPLDRVVNEAGGEIERTLQFDCWQVRVPERAIEALCSLEGVDRIETTATLELGVDDDSTKHS